MSSSTSPPPTGLLDQAGVADLPAALDLVRDTLVDALAGVTRPYAGTTVEQARRIVDGVDLDSPVGDLAAALAELRATYLDHTVWVHHPRYQAHLNCPVALPAVVADVVASVVSTSMDTWDQSGAATLVGQRLVGWVGERTGFGPGAGGTFTSGGTQSNLHGLLLAREAARAAGTDPRRWCVVVPEHAHSSVRRAAHLLGISPTTAAGGTPTASCPWPATSRDGSGPTLSTGRCREHGCADWSPSPSLARPEPPTSARSTRSTPSPTSRPATTPGCTSTRRTAAGCCSPPPGATCSPGSSGPTP